MATYSLGALDAWVGKVERRMTAVARQATNDMINDIEIVPGISRGGAVQRGTIPRDLGALATSFQSSLLGSTAMTRQGSNSHLFVIGKMQAGDLAQFTWGGANAPYAIPIHYGFDTYPGTFWRDEAASKWKTVYVPKATALAKVMFP